MNVWVGGLEFSSNLPLLNAKLRVFDQSYNTPVVIVTLSNQRDYAVFWNDQPIPFHQRYPEFIEIHLPHFSTFAGYLEVSPNG
jgi:hypothetical protein